ncbi:hypothetical protein [Vibrio fortis]|uniref:hypothetical protein n=1 Tax=Vibrio fortis TaxID=212667 RepID=UPI0038CDB6DF
MRDKFTISYVNENSEEIRLSISELNIHLNNEQTLTISSSYRQRHNGITISDHSFSNEVHRAYSLLQVTPCACNIIEVHSSKELCKN